MPSQNDMEKLKDQMQQGLISTDQANVKMVKFDRVKLVTCKIPRSVRNALNAAVKNGELGHVKKEGRKPEAYFHPEFEYLVANKRNQHERDMINAIARVSGRRI